MQILSNDLVLDDKKTKIIDLNVKVNSVGKSEILTNDKVNNRKNFLVLGDILEDVNMVDNIDYENLITIGFLNKPKNVHIIHVFLKILS